MSDGERIAKLEVEVTNLKARIEKTEKTLWWGAVAIIGSVLTTILKGLGLS